jgi:hypothetical protein
VGLKSPACTQAKQAIEVLTDKACGVALEDVPATLSKIKTARADCEKLVGKLCAELGKDSETCKMVTDRTQMFPATRCTEMLGNYDQVLGSLKQMEERKKGGGMGHPGGPPPGHPPMKSPDGSVPGGPRPGGATPGAALPVKPQPRVVTQPAPKQPAPPPAPKPATPPASP